MASTHIYPSTNTRLAGELNALVEDMKKVHANAEKLKHVFDQIASDSDFDSLKTDVDRLSTEVAQKILQRSLS